MLNWDEPPSFPRQVLDRDGWRCMIPGCKTPKLGISCHHIKTRGSGGQDSFENCITLCLVCHNQVHSGKLWRWDLEMWQHEEIQGFLRRLVRRKYGYEEGENVRTL